LGIYIDEKLAWNYQIAHITNICCQRIGVMKKVLLGRVVGQEVLWARKSCGPGRVVGRESCGPGRVVGQEVLWARKSCGPGRVVGQEELWARKSCGPGRGVGQEELWARKRCGPG
jgi:hypothetical protein